MKSKHKNLSKNWFNITHLGFIYENLINIWFNIKVDFMVFIQTCMHI